MKNRKGQNEKRKAKPPAAGGKKKRPQDKAAENRGHRHKSEIQMLGSPALVQLLIRVAVDNGAKPMRKTERPVKQAAKELLIRLGHNRKEAGTLADMIMEQMQ